MCPVRGSSDSDGVWGLELLVALWWVFSSFFLLCVCVCT